MFVNSLNSVGAIKMHMWSWSSSGNVQESQRFIFLNCPTRQVYVWGFFFLPLKVAKANSRALTNSQDLISEAK